jgi:hypothetical protein
MIQFLFLAGAASNHNLLSSPNFAYFHVRFYPSHSVQMPCERKTIKANFETELKLLGLASQYPVLVWDLSWVRFYGMRLEPLQLLALIEGTVHFSTPDIFKQFNQHQNMTGTIQRLYAC